MIDLLSISILAYSLSTLIILFLYLYLYNEERHEYFLIWTVAWAFYFIFDVSSFADAVMRKAPSDTGLRMFWRWLTYASAGVSAVLMLWAAQSFVHGFHFHYGYPVAGLALVGWTTVAVLQVSDFLVLSMPVFVFTGIVFIWTGWVFYARQPKPRLKGTGLLTGAFILWGLHKLDYPFVRPIESFAPYGYALSTAFGQLAAIGLIVLVLEESKRDMRVANNERKNAYRDLEAAMSELKSSVRELDETQEYLSSILESTQDYAIISTDPHGKILLYNETATRMFGRDVASVLGQFASLESYHLGQVEKLMPGLMRTVPREGRYEAESELLRQDGSRFAALLTATAVYNMERQYIGMLIMIRDITQQRELEERVIASEKLATIGRMASYIAHEIKNPLSSVNLNLELLADEIAEYDVSSKDESTELLNSIQEELDRLTSNVDEYLRFARLPKLHLYLGDINITLGSLLQLIGPELAQHGIKVDHDWDYDIPPVRIDTQNLRSVFLNLIRNAREAMTSGGILRVSTEHSDDAVLIHVLDSGHGISEDELQSIFEPFYTTKASGTGLGLPYAQQIIHQHGGSIRCTSVLGEGTRFTISIPSAQLEPEET